MSALPTPGDEQRRTGGPALRLLGAAAAATPAAASPPVLVDERAQRTEQARHTAPGLHADGPHILVAGADAARRTAVLRELAGAFGAHARFEETDRIWDVLQRAPFNQVVMLTGDLADGSADSTMRILGRRHPGLPVVTLGS